MRNTDSSGKTSLTILLSSLARLQVVAERLLDDDAAPLRRARVWARPGALELLDHRRERARRDRQVERVVAARAALLRRGRATVSEPGCRTPASSSKVPCTNRKPSASRSQTAWRNGVRACSFTASCTTFIEVLVGPVAAGEPDQREARRQQTPVREVVDRGHELLARQVTGHPEDHQRRTGPRCGAAACPARRAAGCARCRVTSRPPGRPHELGQPGGPVGRGAAAAPGGRVRRAPGRRRAPARAAAAPSVYGRPGTSRSSLDRAGDLQEHAVLVTALVVLARSSAGTAAPSRTWSAGRVRFGELGAQQRRPTRRRAGPGTPAPRCSRTPGATATSAASASADGADLARQPSRRRGTSTGPSTKDGLARSRRPVRRAVTRAAFFAASTSGWSNGLMPSTRPTNAVAYSHSRNCAPSGRPRPRRRAGRPGRSRRSWRPSARRRSRARPGPRRRPAADRCRSCRWTRRSAARPSRRSPGCRSRCRRRRPSRRRAACAAPKRGRQHARAGFSGRSCDRTLAAAAALVEQLADVRAGEPGRHQTERGQRRVAAADVRVGQEDLAVTGFLRTRFATASPGSVTTTIRDAASMPSSANACSKIRRWLSVSTVAPDLDDTTSTVRSRSPASASATWPGSVVSSTTSGTPAVRGDHLGGERRAAHPREHDPVDALGVQLGAQRLDLGHQRARRLVQRRPRQPDRRLGLGVRAPQRGVLRGRASLGTLESATRSRNDACRLVLGRAFASTISDGASIGSVTVVVQPFAAVSWPSTVSSSSVPGLLELLDALVLQGDEHVVEVDARRRSAASNTSCASAAACR